MATNGCIKMTVYLYVLGVIYDTSVNLHVAVLNAETVYSGTDQTDVWNK